MKQPTLKTTRMLNIVIPIEVDQSVKGIQDQYEAAGYRKYSKADICVQLIQKGLECSDFNDLVALSPEFDFEEKVDHVSKSGVTTPKKKVRKEKVGV